MKYIFVLIFLFLGIISVKGQQVVSLTWSDVVGISRNENLEIKIRYQDYLYQDKNKWKALGDFLPTVDYQFQAVNNIELPEFVIPNFGRVRFGTDYNFTHVFQARLPLFTGGARWANWQIQDNLAKSMEAQLRDKEDQVVLKALEAYFGMILADNVLRVNQRAYEAAKANFDQVEKFFNLGGASKLDYLRAKSSLSSSIPPLASAKNAQRLAAENLKFIMNIPAADSVIVLDSLRQMNFINDLEKSPLTDLYNMALENRPDLEQMNLQGEIASDQKLLAVSRFLPTIAVAANVQHQAQVMDAAFVPNDFVRSKAAVLSVQVPLFQGAKRVFDYQQASISQQRAEISADLLQRAALLEIESSVLKIAETKNNLSTLRSAMDEAREAERLANLNYNEGVITQVDVLGAILALTNSELRYLRGIYEFNISQLYLLKAVGKMNSVWQN